VRELLLSPDAHQRSLVEDAAVGCVLHDFERDFDVAETARIGAIRIALAPRLIVTTRLHPLRCADIARQRLASGATLNGPPDALDLLVGAICAHVSEISRTLASEIQAAEDAFLEGRDPPASRDLIGIRRRLAQLHRLLDGMRNVFLRLEEDDDLPAPLRPVVEKLSQRLQALDGDILGAQGELRLLRDELEGQAAQRTNQNLYILSIMTALLLPATLITGIFGMNTGGLPFSAGAAGTFYATTLAIGAAAATYGFLRWLGFMRR
jgi:zinc transporter